MKANDALLERWRGILAQHGDEPAIFNPGGDVARSFRQIENCAEDFRSKIGHFEAGRVLAVQIGNHANWPAILIACLRREVVVLPLEKAMGDRQRDAALNVCRVSAIIENEADLREVDHSRHDWGGKTPALLKLTSGTTAAARAVRFQSEQLLADCGQIYDTMGISDVDLNFGVIPISHSYGFSNLLTPLIARGVPMVLSQDRTPRAVLDHLARTNATVFPGTPPFYQAFCEMENVRSLPKLRLCISAGAPLPLAIAKKFREKFGLPIHSFYGASECGGVCYDREAKNEIEGFIGTPMKDVDLEMTNSNSASSQVRVRSAAVGDGYFPDPDEEKLAGGIFIPDDLLERSGDGFKIVGRVSDLINVAGKKVNPVEIEEALLSFPGIRQAVAFGRPAAAGLRNEEAAACVAGDAGLNEGNLLEFCRKTLSAWQVPKRIFIVDAIPANERGKISRRELAKRFTL